MEVDVITWTKDECCENSFAFVLWDDYDEWISEWLLHWWMDFVMVRDDYKMVTWHWKTEFETETSLPIVHADEQFVGTCGLWWLCHKDDNMAWNLYRWWEDGLDCLLMSSMRSVDEAPHIIERGAVEIRWVNGISNRMNQGWLAMIESNESKIPKGNRKYVSCRNFRHSDVLDGVVRCVEDGSIERKPEPHKMGRCHVEDPKCQLRKWKRRRQETYVDKKLTSTGKCKRRRSQRKGKVVSIR